ncbi:MAG: hypothetical protein AAGE03_17155, partial [Pseudomonadota bacterium]
SEGAVVYADGWTACASLRPQGDHVMMRKDKGWSMGQDQINGIEGLWRDAKNLAGAVQRRASKVLTSLPG